MPFQHAVKIFARLAFIVLLSSSLSPTAVAIEDYTAVTASNADIDVADLQSLLLPLDQSQLEVEAQAWQNVLAGKLQEIAALEIRTRHAGTPPSQLPDQAGAVKEQDRSELETLLAQKRVEQSAISKRVETVLDAWASKGGDVAKQKLYLGAVSGINLDVGNTTAGLLAVKDWLQSGDGGLQLLLNFLKFIVAIAVIVFLSRMAGRITDRIVERQSVSMLLKNFVKVGVRRTVLAIGFIVSLPILGIDVGPVLALIGAAGLVVGLALQGTLSNFASGVLILIYRPYDINDAVKAGDVTGVVSSMNLLCTTIKTFDNQLITIPNNSIWNNSITNITGSHERRVDMVFGISYADDFAKAQGVLRDILQQHPKVLETPAPVIRVHELADSSVNIICRPWSKTEDYWDVYWDVTETVKREFDRQDISIPFPQRDVHFYPAADAAGKTA